MFYFLNLTDANLSRGAIYSSPSVLNIASSVFASILVSLGVFLSTLKIPYSFNLRRIDNSIIKSPIRFLVICE